MKDSEGNLYKISSDKIEPTGRLSVFIYQKCNQ